MLRQLMVAMVAWALAPTAAFACDGQSGTTIFEDSFADDSGGWDPAGGAENSEIKDGKMVLHPNPGGAKEKFINLTVANLTFSAGEGDFCADFVLPKPSPPDNDATFGLVFLRQDKNNYYAWEASTDKGVYLYKLSAGTWTTIYTNKAPPAPVKLEPNAVNSIRVVVKDGKLTLLLNGQQVKVIRAQIPTGELHFGVYADVNKASDQNPIVQVKGFKITSGQQ